ncbi:MAG: hypothetical protein LAO31_23115 [Acidobacteriia bacterium]|nr:hypothetical protein [Terriglobia bacterium]
MWVIAHGLSVTDGRLQDIRPIHVLTFLAQHLAQGDKSRIFGLSFALENKLFSARHALRQLGFALSGVNEPFYSGGYVREYESHQVFLAALDAMLSATYSALEIAAQLNKSFHPELPHGFRKQARRFELFGLARNKWVARMLDIRSELSHFGTALISIPDGKVILQFTTEKRLEAFDRGRYQIELREIFGFPLELFALLDEWALSELRRVPPDQELDGFRQTSANAPLQHEKVKAVQIMSLMGESDAVKKDTAPDGGHVC